jgi:hypothetical protein
MKLILWYLFRCCGRELLLRGVKTATCAQCGARLKPLAG